MKTAVIIGMLGMGILLGACQPEGKGGGAPKGEDTLVAGGGYVQEVEALGYAFVGEPSTDWRLYETLRYDSAGREVEKQTHWDGGKTKIVTRYDKAGRKVLVKRTGQDRLGDVDYTTHWSEDGRKSTEEEYIHREERMILRTVTVFDSGGKVLERRIENHQFPEVGVDTQKTRYTYDGRGLLTFEEEFFQGRQIPSVRYGYDEKGQLVKLERFDADGNVSRTEYFEYDAQGRKKRLRMQDAGMAQAQLERTYGWDAGGRLLEEHLYGGDCSAEGEKKGQCRIVESVRMTYDAEGRPLTKDTYKEGKPEAVMQLRYRYAPFKP